MIPHVAVGVALIFHTSSLFAQADAAPTNITVDDTNSTYWTWAGSWHAVTPSSPCVGCLDQPDPSQIYNHTWHDGGLRSGSFTFQGSAVYIYGTDVLNPANISFSMNNPSITGFHYYAGTDYVYRSLFFAATGLDSTVQHTVTWILEQSSTGGIAASFDYAVFTVDEPDTSGPSNTNAVGGISTTSSSSASARGTNPAGGTSMGATPSTSPLLSSGSSTSPSNTHAGGISIGVTASSSTASESTGSSAPAKHKSKTGPIVGAVIAVVGGLALLGALFICLRHRPSSRPKSLANSNVPSSRMVAPTGYLVEPYQLPTPEIAPAPSTVTTLLTAPTVPSSQILTVASNSKSPPEPVVSATDPHPDPGRPRDLEVEERLRHLEALAANSQPPPYH
ncbi:hypothetical protein FB451DRAFT_1229268 [Mycena latifolia]|nr:hypothetical protein FB451DRAFT_1229268 [Mycena latifolia]